MRTMPAELLQAFQLLQKNGPTTENALAKWVTLGESTTRNRLSEECNWHMGVYWEMLLERYESPRP